MSATTASKQYAPAARWTFAALVHAEALLTEHSNARPSYSYASEHEWATWYAQRDALVMDRDAELASVARLLCRKCQGTGTTQWKHRSDGVCYSCKGDGWSAAGRKARKRQKVTS